MKNNDSADEDKWFDVLTSVTKYMDTIKSIQNYDMILCIDFCLDEKKQRSNFFDLFERSEKYLYFDDSNKICYFDMPKIEFDQETKMKQKQINSLIITNLLVQTANIVSIFFIIDIKQILSINSVKKFAKLKKFFDYLNLFSLYKESNSVFVSINNDNQFDAFDFQTNFDKLSLVAEKSFVQELKHDIFTNNKFLILKNFIGSKNNIIDTPKENNKMILLKKVWDLKEKVGLSKTSNKIPFHNGFIDYKLNDFLENLTYIYINEIREKQMVEKKLADNSFQLKMIESDSEYFSFQEKLLEQVQNELLDISKAKSNLLSTKSYLEERLDSLNYKIYQNTKYYEPILLISKSFKFKSKTAFSQFESVLAENSILIS